MVRIHFRADRRTRRSSHKCLPHAADLRQLLRQDRIGGIVHLRQRNCVGSQRKNENGCVRGIDFAVSGISGQVRGQLTSRRVDGGLHIASGSIDVSVQIELQNNIRRADLARGRHLVHARNAPELALQGSRYRRSHCLRTRSGKPGLHLNDRELHLRQRRNRQVSECQDSCQEQSNRQQRRADRTFYKWRRNAQINLPSQAALGSAGIQIARSAWTNDRTTDRQPEWCKASAVGSRSGRQRS